MYVFSDDRACNERKFQETAASVEVASQQQPPSQVTDQTSTVIGQQGIVQPLIQFEGMNLKQVSLNLTHVGPTRVTCKLEGFAENLCLIL